MIEVISAAVGAFGLGAIAQSLVQHWLAAKKYVRERDFKEKREAYLGFLDSVTKSEVSSSRENSLTSGHWINRCKLVGSQEVVELLEGYLRSNPTNEGVHPDRPVVFAKLLDAMRKDLKGS